MPALRDAEVARYRMVTQRTAEDEADQWVTAGNAAGAVVAEVGCGPGAVSAVLAKCCFSRFAKTRVISRSGDR